MLRINEVVADYAERFSVASATAASMMSLISGWGRRLYLMPVMDFTLGNARRAPRSVMTDENIVLYRQALHDALLPPKWNV